MTPERNLHALQVTLATANLLPSCRGGNNSSLLFMAENILLYFVYPLISWMIFGLFLPFWPVNSVAMNIPVQVYNQLCNSLKYPLEGKSLSHMAILFRNERWWQTRGDGHYPYEDRVWHTGSAYQIPLKQWTYVAWDLAICGEPA